jgi:hypothetical protein
MTISPEQLAALKERNPCDHVAGKWVALRRHGNHLIGACPICGGGRRATRFEAWPDRWACAVCPNGGDVIRLVMEAEGLDFLRAVEWLGGAQAVSAAAAERLAQARAELEAHRTRDAAHFRERERSALFEMWTRAAPAEGTAVAAYLALRGLALPDGCRLRAIPRMPYYAGGGDRGDVVGYWAAMVAPIIGVDGKFAGLHFTYIDLDAPKGKAAILDPEGEALPAKKVRGSKARGRIELVRPGAVIEQLVIGEGIEKTLAVWLALARTGRDLSGMAFWSAVDLGNMSGRARETVTHPGLRTAKDRPQRVPGPDPDMDDPGIPIPQSVADLVLLGDSTSDPFTTRCAMYRACQRYARPGRTVRVAWAPAGKDFDDVVREAA